MKCPLCNNMLIISHLLDSIVCNTTQKYEKYTYKHFSYLCSNQIRIILPNYYLCINYDKNKTIIYKEYSNFPSIVDYTIFFSSEENLIKKINTITIFK